jgi:hypothetical protein
MKSFNQFLGEAEEKTPERKKLDLNIPKEPPKESLGQQSLPGMGKRSIKITTPITPAKGAEYLDPKTGQASDEGVRRYMNKRNTKGYFRTEGKPSAVKPEDVKSGLEKKNVDMQNPQEVQSVKNKINQKYGRKPADDAFAKKLGLDTPEGAAAAQDAARDMAADAKKGQVNLKGGPTPQVKSTIPQVKPSTSAPAPTAAQVRPRGQGSRPVGSTTTRGGAPQLPTLGAKSKPTPVTPAKTPIVKKPVAAKPPELPKIDPETQAPKVKPRATTDATLRPSQGMTSTRTGSASYKPPSSGMRAFTQRVRQAGNVSRVVAGAASLNQGYSAGRQRGESPASSALRGTFRAAGGVGASTLAGVPLLRMGKPGLAASAATLAYPAGEATGDRAYDAVRNWVRSFRSNSGNTNTSNKGWGRLK